MRKIFLLVAVLFTACNGESAPSENQTTAMNPNDLAYNDYVHESLPVDFLDRIRVTTDVFEPIDGISFEQAVDMYKRDFDPEPNLIIWEEMARVYQSFCESDCPSMEKKKEVYRALLLASMWPKEEATNQLNAQILTVDETNRLISMYQLPPEPITVMEK